MTKEAKLEKDDEKYLARWVKQYGGISFKFTSPGARGVPDRIVITPNGEVYFVELKRKSGVVSSVQKWRIEEMKLRNCKTRILYGREDIDLFLCEIFPKHREEVMR